MKNKQHKYQPKCEVCGTVLNKCYNAKNYYYCSNNKCPRFCYKILLKKGKQNGQTESL